MNGSKKEKDNDVLYLDVEEFLSGKGIEVDMNNNKVKEEDKNEK